MARKELVYGLVQSLSLLAFTNADFSGTPSNNCVNFDLARLEELASTFDVSTSPLLNSTSDYENDRGHLLPFGALRIDWSRLNLLRDALPNDSVLRSKFKHVFRLLLIAHDEATRSTPTFVSKVLENDNVMKKTTESFFTEKDESTQGIYKESPVVESEESPSSTRRSQETKSNIKMPPYVATSNVLLQHVTESYETVTKDDIDKVIVTDSNESSTLDNKENSTVSSIPETTSTLIESPTKFEQAIGIMTMSESYFDPTDANFVTDADVTPTTNVTKPRKTSYIEETIPITTTIFSEKIFTNSNDKSSSSIIGEIPSSTFSTLLSDVVGKEITLSHKKSQDTSEVVSSNFTSSTEPIVKEEFEQLSTREGYSSVGTIVNSFSKEISSPSAITSWEISTSTAMVKEATLWTSPSTMESSISESLELTMTKKATSPRIAGSENTSWDQLSTTMNLAELSSTRDEYSSTRTFVMPSVTPDNKISIPKEQQLKKTSWTDLSTIEENSLAGMFETSFKTDSQSSTTNPREEVLMSRQQEIKEVATTQFPTFEEFPSTASFFDLRTINDDVLTTTPSENRSVSTKQEVEKRPWVYSSSIATNPFQSSESTDFSTEIHNVTLNSLQQEESSSIKVPTQSTFEDKSSSDHSISQAQNIWTTLMPTQKNNTEQSWETINPMDNVDANINSNHRMEIMTNAQTTTNGSIFTGSSTIFSSTGDLVEQAELTDFPGETTTQDSTAMHLSTNRQIERTTLAGLYLTGSSTIDIAEEPTEDLSDSRYSGIDNSSKNETLIENVGTNNQWNETGRTTEQTDTSDITSQSKTSSYLEIPTTMAKLHFVKNPLHRSSSKKNNIFRDYKHGSDNSIKEQNSESPEIVLYGSVAGFKNENFWRPEIARISPTGNTIRQFDTFSKNFPPGSYQQSSIKTTKADGPGEQEVSTKWPLYRRTNVLRLPKRGSANSGIEKQFLWFSRQSGQFEGEDKSRNEDGSKMKMQCKNARHH